jgi:hypothetical protein
VSEGKNNTETRPQSKFEWRPEDITILGQENGDAAEAESDESLVEMDWEGTYANPSATTADPRSPERRGEPGPA